MSDDAPTARAAGGPGRPATAVEALLASWVAAGESGQAPRLADFLARLPGHTQREQFVDLLDQLAFADRHMPLRLRPNLVLGGRYELLESIGSGGMGQVWRALDRSLGREVAVKVLDLASAAALDLDHLVAREIRLLARMSHPGIVRLHDVGRDGEHRFLVMDLVRGVALDDVVAAAQRWRESNRTPYDVRELLERTGPAAPGATPLLRGDEPWSRAVVAVVVELLRTLEAAHAAGIVHRDIKPANVRLSGGGAPVLLDFGIGVATGSTPGALTAGLFGTAQYAAPEQWAGGSGPGVPTDVYQTGLVLYELLTLRRCFASSNPMETMRAVRTATYARPRAVDPGIDPALEACVLRAMEVEPTRRYRSAADFRSDLEAYLAGQVPRAAAATARVGQRVRALVRRRRRSLSIAAAMLVGALGLWVLQPSPPPTVRWVTATSASVTVGDPALMAAFRIAYDANGACWCAPLRLDSGPEQPVKLSFGHAVPAGTTDVSLRDVADPTRYPRSVVSTVLVGAADEQARRRFEAFVDAMEVARRTIADRDGEWLSEAEFRALLAPGRGGGASDVPIDRLFAAGAWQDGGLVGAVVAPPPAPPSHTARNVALLVGIDKYAPGEDGPTCADLGGPRNDVERVQRTLLERFGFAAEDVHVLVGADATHANVVRAFHEHLIRGATAESRVVFWFSGHGSRIPDASGRDRAVRDEEPFDDTLLLYDSRSVAPHGGFDFTDDELASLLAAVPAQDVLVVTDCCHSGGVLRGAPEPGTREGDLGDEPLDRTRTEAFWPADVPFLDDDAHGDLPAVVHVAACGSEEQAGEIATPAGTFGTLTWFLTNTLHEIDAAASWERVAARVRARVAGTGTRPGQRVAAIGDVGRAIFGGRGRPVAAGYQVDRHGTNGLLLAAGTLQGFAEGAEVRLVDLDGKELGTAVAENVRTSTAQLRWQGAGGPPREAMRAVARTPGRPRPPLRVFLGPGVDSATIRGCDSATVEPDRAAATHVLEKDGDAFVLRDGTGGEVRRVPSAAEVPVALGREHCFRALWEGVADAGQFRVRIRVEPATADEAAKHDVVPAQVRGGNGKATVVGAARLSPRSGGSLAAITVTNDEDQDLHVALLSLTEDREVNVVFGRDTNNLVRAHGSERRLVLLGPGERWPTDRAMVDRYVVITTARHADFTPFESRPTATRGGATTAEMPPFLRQAMGGALRGGGEGPWGITSLDLHLVTPDLFATSGRR